MEENNPNNELPKKEDAPQNGGSEQGMAKPEDGQAPKPTSEESMTFH